MTDNPLVGDYSKGISKDGVAYFRNLEMRALFEKARLSPIAMDMQMGLFRDSRETLNKSVKATGSGRFGARMARDVVPHATKSVVIVIANDSTLTAPKVAGKTSPKLVTQVMKVSGLSSLRLLYEKQHGL